MNFRRTSLSHIWTATSTFNPLWGCSFLDATNLRTRLAVSRNRYADRGSDMPGKQGLQRNALVGMKIAVSELLLTNDF